MINILCKCFCWLRMHLCLVNFAAKKIFHTTVFKRSNKLARIPNGPLIPIS